jgi:hypothetical protein
MTAGFPVVSNDVNTTAGSLTYAVWKALEDVRRFKLWLDDGAHTDAYLNNLGITGTSSSGDVQILRNGIADLGGASGLWAVAHSSFAPAGLSNYFANAKNLTGINYAG